MKRLLIVLVLCMVALNVSGQTIRITPSKYSTVDKPFPSFDVIVSQDSIYEISPFLEIKYGLDSSDFCNLWKGIENSEMHSFSDPENHNSQRESYFITLKPKSGTTKSYYSVPYGENCYNFFKEQSIVIQDKYLSQIFLEASRRFKGHIPK